MSLHKKLPSNNFDFLRLLFASLVIVSHSYPLTGKDEYFASITNGQLGLGGFSVECFFIMSGYLIFISLQNSKTIVNYLWKRVLRIFPALVGLLLVTGIILTFVSGNPKFILSKYFILYGLNVLSLYNVTYNIGSIFSTNPYPYAINGSLWSLSYEFSMYILMIAFFGFKKSKISLYILSGLFIVCAGLYLNASTLLQSFFQNLKLDTNQLYKLITYFIAGSLLTYVDIKRWNTFLNRCILFTILAASLLLTCFKEVAVVILPIFIIFAANASTPYLNAVAKKTGDLSYGIYIYGFLVQQSLMYFFHLDTWPLTFFSLIIAAALAYTSWHLIEKRMMTFKNLL